MAFKARAVPVRELLMSMPWQLKCAKKVYMQGSRLAPMTISYYW